MKAKKKRTGVERQQAKRLVIDEVEGSAEGLVAGAALGMFAGPAGALAGAVIGGVAGEIAGAVFNQEQSAEAARVRALDAEIGVSEGELGAPNLAHPEPTTGAYSAASSGAESDGAGEEPAEGPTQRPND